MKKRTFVTESHAWGDDKDTISILELQDVRELAERIANERVVECEDWLIGEGHRKVATGSFLGQAIQESAKGMQAQIEGAERRIHEHHGREMDALKQQIARVRDDADACFKQTVEECLTPEYQRLSEEIAKGVATVEQAGEIGRQASAAAGQAEARAQEARASAEQGAKAATEAVQTLRQIEALLARQDAAFAEELARRRTEFERLSAEQKAAFEDVLKEWERQRGEVARQDEQWKEAVVQETNAALGELVSMVQALQVALNDLARQVPRPRRWLAWAFEKHEVPRTRKNNGGK